MAGNLRPRLVALCFVAEDDPAEFDLLGDAPAAMVGETRIVVADDPCPVETRGERRQQLARARVEAITAEAIVEAVTEAIEAGRARPLDLTSERGQRRVRIIGRKELAGQREPAGFFKVQIGDEHGLARGPIERTSGAGRERFACERKGNHHSVIARSEATTQSEIVMLNLVQHPFR